MLNNTAMQTITSVTKRLGLIRSTISEAENTVGGIENLRKLSKFRRFEQETIKRFPIDEIQVANKSWGSNLTAEMITQNGKYSCE